MPDRPAKSSDSDAQREALKGRLLAVLTRHPGRARAIGMGALHEAVFKEGYRGGKINGTRMLRKLITELREDGVPICSAATPDGGGYYLATAGSDLDDYCRNLRCQALKKLKLESTLRRRTLPQLVSEIQLNLSRTGS